MEWLVVLSFFVGLGSSVLSGMSGGGGSFISMPYFLLVAGMPPANALATSKLGGVGTSFGAMTAFRGKGLVHKGLVYKFMAITVVCALASAWIIPRLDPEMFQRLIGAFLLLMTPTLFIDRSSFGAGRRSRRWAGLGLMLYAVFSFLQTLVGTGMGSILVLVLMFVFGLGALESNATKRVAQSVQSVILFVLLAAQGLVLWWHGLAALLGATVGSHIGTRVAIKRGDKFVKVMLAVVMFASGAALLF